jgi:hypothetical protein
MHLSADRSRRAAWLALPLAVIASGVIVGTSSYAAFSAQTENAANSWKAGVVELTDDDRGQALFDVEGLVPGDQGSNVVTVTATTSKASTVKLYTKDSVDDRLAQHLKLTVERGRLDVPGDADSFSPDDTVLDGTLAELQTATDFSSGRGAWVPTTGSESAVYRFSYELDAATPNTSQGAEADTTFVWEAQSN